MPGVLTATSRPHDRVQGASVNVHRGETSKTGASKLSKAQVGKAGDEGQGRGGMHKGKGSISDVTKVTTTHENIRNKMSTVNLKASPTSKSESLCSSQENDAANSSSKPESQRQRFVAFGIEANFTRARLNEICRMYLHHRCPHGKFCHRIHPRNSAFYYQEYLREKAEVGISRSEAETASISQYAGHSAGYDGASSDGLTDAKVKLPPTKSCRPPGWDYNTGQWDSGLNNTAWNDSGNSSDDSVADSSLFLSARNGSFRPPPVGDVPVIRKTRPRNAEICRDWLHGRCFWGYSCIYVHEDLEYDDDLKPPGLSTSRVDELQRPGGDDSASSTRGPPGLSGEPSKHEGRVDRPFPFPTRPPGLDIKHPKREVLQRESPRPESLKREVHADRPFPIRPPGLGIKPPKAEVLRGESPQPPRKPPGLDSERSKLEARNPAPKLSTHFGKNPEPSRPDSDKTTRSEVCRNARHGQCNRGYQCRFLHEDLVHHDGDIPKKSGSESSSSRPTEPRSIDDMCWDSIRGRCPRGASCRWVHKDSEHNVLVTKQPETAPLSVSGESRPRTRPESIQPPSHVVARPPDFFSSTLHKHIKVKFGAGFEIQDLVTGFETSWVFVGHVPRKVTEEDITRLLRPYGEVKIVRMPTNVLTQAMTVKALFSSAEEASRASSALNGTQAFGVTITLRLAVSSHGGTSSNLRDTAVRIQWEPPGKVGYGGYPSIERAREAIEATRDFAFGDSYIKASIYSGLPAVGAATVKFHSLPLDTTEDGMEWFAQTRDVMWERPNYTSLPRAINGIQRLLLDNGLDFLEFDVLPPPYKDGMVKAWAHFSTPGEAKAAADRLHNRKPGFIGHTRIFARHVQSIAYAVSPETFKVVEPDIHALGESAWRRGTGSSVSTVPKVASVSVKLCGEDLKELGHLKSELEKILTGVIVRHEGKVVWDDFFDQTYGVFFLQDLEKEHHPLTITKERGRRAIRLLGSFKLREIVHRKIVEKAAELRRQRTFIIPLDGHLVGGFMSADLIRLQETLGPENVDMDLWSRQLKIRGDEEAFGQAKEAVNRARCRNRGGLRSTGAECPVCFEVPTLSITLHCGHRWCRSCLTRYLTTAVDQNFFPLTCLGNEAHCPERIPLGIAREILPAHDFESVLNAAFSAYIHTRPNEFHFCPTPDCSQVYRSGPEGTVLQCPSCLLRICPNCHSEAHDGLACAEADGGEVLFREWMNKNDVKNCPGCKIPIEQAEGCNHMMCTQCQTHICWVCMKTFPKGEGIYGHMRQDHGGFGLGPID